MSVTEGFRAFVLEQLARVTPALRARNMFGGVGVYSDDPFFALMDDDVLYLKVDDVNRARFEARGLCRGARALGRGLDRGRAAGEGSRTASGARPLAELAWRLQRLP